MKRTRGNIIKLVIIVVSAILVYATDNYIRRKSGKQLKEIGKGVKITESDWDRILFNEVIKLFTPEWKDKILDQEVIIKRNPDEPDKIIRAYLEMARIYERQKKYDGAVNACQKIVADYPDNPLRKKAYLKLSSLYEKSEDFVGAREMTDLFIKEFPDDSEVVRAKFKRAESFIGEGNYEKVSYAKDSWAGIAQGELWLISKKGKSGKKIIYAKKAEAPPKIDGVLNEPAWEKADKVGNFVDSYKNIPVSQQTVTSVLYDEKNLYIGFRCLEVNTIGLVGKITTPDGHVWTDDCIEVFFDVNRDYSSYCKITLNILGTQEEGAGKCTNGGHGGCGFNVANWNQRWRSAVVIWATYWNAEMCFPFKELGVSTPRQGSTWGINFNRARRAGEKEISGWTFTESRHHNPGKFGYLTFE